MQVRKEYDALLESGDLLELYPGLKGIWEEDKKIFCEYHELNVKAIKQIDVDYEDV